MTIYNVEVVEKLSRVVEQEANSYTDAKMKVQKRYDDEEIVLDYEDFKKVEYNRYPSPRIKNNLNIYLNYDSQENTICIQNILGSKETYICRTKEDLKKVLNIFVDNHIDFVYDYEEESLRNTIDTLKKVFNDFAKEERKNQIKLGKQAKKNEEKER